MTEVVRAALRRQEEDEAYLAALGSAVVDGNASLDVVGFDEMRIAMWFIMSLLKLLSLV